ncbi:SH3 domain-containing protein [Parvularcula marina]|uniref:SH3 domain-containing protein n=1 Tax=Parvularcula marina TaxID=2292771 RepID=UPI0035153D09
MVRIWPIAAAVSAIALSVTVLPSAIAGAGEVAKPQPMIEADSPSGLPVPRFVALRKDEVRARFGPSFDYPVAYEFRQEGLPLKVIAEDRDNIWRRVEDRDGRRMWIHRSMLSENAHGIVTSDSTILRAAPNTHAKGRARLNNGVMAKIERCEQNWCQVRAADYRGWLPKEQLWGAPI